MGTIKGLRKEKGFRKIHVAVMSRMDSSGERLGQKVKLGGADVTQRSEDESTANVRGN